MRRVFECVLGTSLVLAASCGASEFEREVELESSSVALARQTVEGEYRLVTAEELKGALATDEDMLLVDVMPHEESYQEEHLPGAVSFLFPIDPMGEWDPSRTGGKTTEDFEDLLGPDKERSIVVYCGFVACTRSHNGALWARKLGYQNVWRFPGGLHAWKGVGYATESSG